MTSTLPRSDVSDITQSLEAARKALRKLLESSAFRDYLLRAAHKGPLNDLDRRERDGQSHFRIIKVRGNGIDTPHATFLVLSIPYGAEMKPCFEREVTLRVRQTGERDGFEETHSSRSEEFCRLLGLCSNPSHLEGLIVATFGR